MKHYRYRNLEIAARNGGIAVADVTKNEDLNSVPLIPVPEWVKRIDDLTSVCNTFDVRKDSYFRDACLSLVKGLDVMHMTLKDALQQGDPTNPNVLAELSEEFKRSHKAHHGVGKGLLLCTK